MVFVYALAGTLPLAAFPDPARLLSEAFPETGLGLPHSEDTLRHGRLRAPRRGIRSWGVWT